MKPALDTTENISDSAGGAIGKSQRAFQRELRQADVPAGSSSYGITSDNPRAIRKATECISRAGDDPVRIQECVDRVTK